MLQTIYRFDTLVCSVVAQSGTELRRVRDVPDQ